MANTDTITTTSRPTCCGLPMRDDGFRLLTRPGGKRLVIGFFRCAKCLRGKALAQKRERAEKTP